MWIRFSGPVPTVKPVVGTTLGRFQGVIGLSDAFAIDPDHPITKLDPARPKHWLIARLLAHGVCDERIAQHVDISEFTVKQYARNPQTQAMIEHLDQIKAEIDMLNEERFDDLQNVFFAGVMRTLLSSFGRVHHRLEERSENGW